MSMSDELHVAQVAEFVFEVEIRRGPHNYFSPSLIRALADELDRLDNDPACRAVVLCSEGKNFCAGADFQGEMAELGAAERLYTEALRLFAVRMPIVAAIQGAAIGGGLGLALAADFRVGTSRSRLVANFSRLGLHQGFGISVTLPMVIGSTRAAELLLSGRSVPGEEALRLGLLDELAADDASLRSRSVEYTRQFVQAAPLAVQSIKETLRTGLREQLSAVLERELSEQTKLFATEDFKEGVQATRERRTPVFRGV